MMAKRVLDIPIKREWFDKIVKGSKRSEYRSYTKHWKSRLEGRDYDEVRFRAGYTKQSPEAYVELRGIGGDGKSRNADYVIKLGRVLRTKRLRSKD